MHPKGQGECKHRLMGMFELLKCCAASTGGRAALRTWGIQGMQGEQGCCSSLPVSVPPWADQHRNKEIPCPTWSRGEEETDLQRGAAPLPAHLDCMLGEISHSFPSIHQRLWDKRGELSKLCLPSPSDTSVFSLEGHKIKSAFGL